MKWIIKYYGILLWGHFLRLFFSIYPIKKHTVVFVSFDGEKVSCNPYYIYKYLTNKDEFDLFWVVNDKRVACDIPDERVIISKGYAYYKLMFTAGFVITNDRLASFFLFRKGQTLINTWHGGGAFKRTFGYPKGILKWYNERTTSLDSRRTNLFLSSSRIWTDVIARKSFLYTGEVLQSGFPRNDLFFYYTPELRDAIKEKIGVSKDFDVILYAPTYRSNALSGSRGSHTIAPLDIKQIKETWTKKTGNTCVVLFRGHHVMRNSLPLEDTIDVSSYPDMQELLLIADVLISDYSSCMWDFSLTKRPCFIYAPDFDNYLYNPGFESDYRDWPFIICRDNETIIQALLLFNNKEYIDSIDRYLLSYGSYENGCASQKVFMWMQRHLG